MPEGPPLLATHPREPERRDSLRLALCWSRRCAACRYVAVGGDWVDIFHIARFSRDCLAVRQRTSSLILLGNGLVERRVEGSALDVLNEVLTWEPPP